MADIFVSLLKGFVVLGVDAASKVIIHILLVVWCYTRCVILSNYIWEIASMALSGSILAENVPNYFIGIVYMDLGILALVTLGHYSWFYSLLKITMLEGYKNSKAPAS